MWHLIAAVLSGSLALFAWQDAGAAEGPGWKRVQPDRKDGFMVETGTRIPLSMINSVSTKSATEGDRLYLETVFPVVVSGRVVVPAGSYVTGTFTEVKRAGRVKGRAELYVRFDSLTLPN